MKVKKMIGWIAVLSLAIVFGTFAKPAANTDLSQLDQKDQKLVQQLQDEKADKRMQAAQKLAKRNCVAAENLLVKMMQNDTVYQARIVAAMSLMELDLKQTLPAIKKQAENDENKIVRNALGGIVSKMEQDS